MSADSFDGFEYEPVAESATAAQRAHYQAVGIGLQAVDGLEVSPYLRERAQEYVRGERSLQETGELVRAFHAAEGSAEHAEADLVSQRIAELLERQAFSLVPEFLPEVHRFLFQDLDPTIFHPGEFKRERLMKREAILNGDSVLYADPLTYEMSLRAAFAAEAAKSYGAMDYAELKGFVHTIAFLWQVHPFHEGNTRTIAVFSELYLNALGFQVENEPFSRHARYFRDSLVRAMYRNPQAGIVPDEGFLRAFYENLLGKEHHELDPAALRCERLFEEPSLIRNAPPTR